MVLDFLAADNFDFTRKIVKKNWVKNLWKCWGFVKIEFLDKNLTFRIVWAEFGDFKNVINSNLKQFSSMTNKTIFKPFILECLAWQSNFRSSHYQWAEALLLFLNYFGSKRREKQHYYRVTIHLLVEFTFSWRIFARFYYYKHGLGPTLVRHNSQSSKDDALELEFFTTLNAN